MANIPTKIFRGKAKDKNDYYFLSQAFPEKCKNGFIYGQLIIDERQNRYYICVSIIATMNCTIANGTVTVIEVIPETIGQYIGLVDNHKEKIFDGDILQGNKYPYCSDGKYNYYAEVVRFNNCCCGIGLYTFKNPKSTVKGISDGNCECLENFDSNNWLVIDNIHDNPEMLEVSGNE